MTLGFPAVFQFLGLKSFISPFLQSFLFLNFHLLFPCSFVLPLQLYSGRRSVNLFCLRCIFLRYVLLFPSLFLFLHNLSVNF